MTRFSWIAVGAAILLTPVLSWAYYQFRLEARREQLKALFSRPGILAPYLRSKGERLEGQAKETQEDYHKRLHNRFQIVFDRDFSREYGWSYGFAVLLGTIFSALVVIFLVSEGVNQSLLGTEEHPVTVPSAVKFGLLGAFFWNVWVLVRGYSVIDLVPSAFYWITLRYLLGIAVGLLAGSVFKDDLANLGAFAIASLPVSDVMKFLRARLTQSGAALVVQEGQPPLHKLQGMPSSTIARLEEVGIQTTQELGNIDPLWLLFRTNFPPKVVIDWIDQALLYNYIGDLADKLRVRGIRGAIEAAAIALEPYQKQQDLLQSIAAALAIQPPELEYFITMLRADNQVNLVWAIWNELEPPGGAAVDAPADAVPGAAQQEQAGLDRVTEG